VEEEGPPLKAMRFRGGKQEQVGPDGPREDDDARDDDGRNDDDRNDKGRSKPRGR